MTTAPTTVPEVLRASAEWIAEDPDRWGRDYFIAPVTGCRCASGAIARVLDPIDRDGDPTNLVDYDKTDLGRHAVAILADYLVDHEGAKLDISAVATVGTWNDEADRTAAEVVAAMEAAAADYSQRQAARAAQAVTA